MNYLSVAETAKKWNMSERTVRNYCAGGKINVLFLQERLGISRIPHKSPIEKSGIQMHRAPCWKF